MPPANSPNREPTPFTSALRGLESPVNDDVLNLAATLTAGEDSMEGEMDQAHASLRYLRREQARDEQRLEESRNRLRQLERTRDDLDHRDRLRQLERTRDDLDHRDRLRQLERTRDDLDHRDRLRQLERTRDDLDHRDRLRQLERTRDDLDHRDRLRRSMDRLNRLHEASAQAQFAQHNQSPYGEQIPSQNSLNDWAPHGRLGTAHDLDEAELERRSLRSTAILQAVRRHPRFSARTREYLQRFTYDRERERERERERDTQRERDTERERDRETMREAAREGHPAGPRYHSSAQPAAQPPTVAPMLQHTVNYLSQIRHASTVDESLNCALEAGFLSKDYFCIQYADFLTDTLTMPPPHETSWLAPGAVLSGCQHATTSTATPNLNSTSQLPPPSRPWLSTSYSTPRSLTSYLPPSRTDPTQPPPQQDRWPVKVTVHAVDWSSMSLSATMEAYNVPSHPHQNTLLNPPNNTQYTRTSSITTYLEGEILDFNRHTLLTESFTSSAATDALYWRKLPPFRDLGDEEVVRALTSRRWWEKLGREWVLMRWKERCFVKSLRHGSRGIKLGTPAPAATEMLDAYPRHETATEYYTYDSHTFARHAAPQLPDESARYSLPAERAGWGDGEHAAFDDSGCGLTISGFYYVCLRREDGRVEGLYYDPMSSPYQCLVLESRPRKAFAKWEFA